MLAKCWHAQGACMAHVNKMIFLIHHLVFTSSSSTLALCYPGHCFQTSCCYSLSPLEVHHLPCPHTSHGHYPPWSEVPLSLRCLLNCTCMDLSVTAEDVKVLPLSTARNLGPNPGQRAVLCSKHSCCVPVLLLNLWSLYRTLLRLIFNLPKFAHVTPLLRDLHWLPFVAPIRFKTMMLALKTINGAAPGTLVRPHATISAGRLVPPSLRAKKDSSVKSWLSSVLAPQ